MQRIGLFGGTFDPVHFGHLRSAIELTERYALDTLRLLPNHRPVHRDAAQASTQQRIDMLELALENCPRLTLDVREALHDRPSYTVETLRAVKSEHPGCTLIFFLGMDAFAKFDTWHRWGEILELANLVVMQRPDANHSSFSRKLLHRQRRLAGAGIGQGVGVIEQCRLTQLDISASDIRRRLATRLNVRFLLPDTVSEYIVQHGLYRPVG